MYVIETHGKRNKAKFETYEHARQAIRKLMRKKTPLRQDGQPIVQDWFGPTFEMGVFGYSIRKVN
jgi:hypothetical protein